MAFVVLAITTALVVLGAEGAMKVYAGEVSSAQATSSESVASETPVPEAGESESSADSKPAEEAEASASSESAAEPAAPAADKAAGSSEATDAGSASAASEEPKAQKSERAAAEPLRLYARRPYNSDLISTSVQGEITADKTVSDQNADGSYDIRLRVTGATKTEVRKTKVDVCFILDSSGSMAYDFGGYTVSNPSRRRLTVLANCVNDFLTALDNNPHIDSRVAMIKFSGSDAVHAGSDVPWNDASYALGDAGNPWRTPAQALNTSIQLSAGFGTNYEAGLLDGADVVGRMRPDARKIVIFVSDGNPTYYYNRYGYTAGNGTYYEPTALAAAGDVMSNQFVANGKPLINSFYAIGVGGDPYSNDKGYAHLSELLDYAPRGVYTNYYAATSADLLSKKLDDIRATITETSVNNAVVTDTMSPYVNVTKNVRNPRIANTWLEIKDNKTGKILNPWENRPGVTSCSLPGTKEKATIKMVTDSKGQEQVSVVFPKGYDLNPDYSYTLVSNVKFNRKGYDAYLNLPDGAPKTLPTNDNDTTTFSFVDPFTGQSQTQKVPVGETPVRAFAVQKKLDTASVDDPASIAGAVNGKGRFDVSVHVDGSDLNAPVDAKTSPVMGDGLAKTGEDGVYEYDAFELFNLPDTATVKLAEDEGSFMVDGYRMTSGMYAKDHTIADDTPRVLAQVVNTYRSSYTPRTVTTPKVNARKTVSPQRPDGTYDIRMGVSSNIVTQPKPDVDVVFVVDTSYSMNNQDILGGPQKKRILVAANSVNNLANQLHNNKNINAHMSVVYFCTNFDRACNGTCSSGSDKPYDDSKIVMGWGKPRYVFVDDTLPQGEGRNDTNYVAGLRDAQILLDEDAKARPNAYRMVVFLSDGDPTNWYDENGMTGGPVYSLFEQEALDKAQQDLSKMTNLDSFYIVGLGPEPRQYQHLKELLGSVPQGVSGAYAYARDSKTLNSIFSSLGDRLQTIAASHMTVTDTMSDYVDVTSNKVNGRPNVRLEIRNKEGVLYNRPTWGMTQSELPPTAGTNAIYFGKAQIVVDTDPATGRERARVQFPADYALNPDYTYELVSNVRFNEDGFEAYKKLPADAEKMLPTNDNDSTTVTYYVGNPLHQPTPNEMATTKLTVPDTPVRSFAVRKRIEGDDVAAISAMLEGKGRFDLASHVTGSDINAPVDRAVSPKLGEESGLRPLGGGVYEFESFDFFNLPDGATVDVSEDMDTFNADGYTLSVDAEGFQPRPGTAAGTMVVPSGTDPVRATTVLATIVNSYSPHAAGRQVTVSKELRGSGIGDAQREQGFAIYASLVPDGRLFQDAESLASWLREENPGTDVSVSGDRAYIALTLRGGESRTLSLPEGLPWRVEEQAPDGYEAPRVRIAGRLSDMPGGRADISPDVDSATVVNTRNIPAPTLVERHSAPFLFLAVGGGLLIAGLALTRKAV